GFLCSSRRRHTRWPRDWSSDVCSSDLFMTPDSVERSSSKGLDAKALLAKHDSYGFFSALGDLLVTGPTRTIVNDYRAIVVAAARSEERRVGKEGRSGRVEQDGRGKRRE